METTGGPERLAAGTDIGVAFPIIGEVVAGERAVVPLGLVPDRNVWGDASVDQPAEHLAGAVGDIAGDMVRRQAEAAFRPFDHGLGGVHLLGDPGRRRLDIKDHRMVHVDQVVQAVAEHHLVATPGRPGGRGIDWR